MNVIRDECASSRGGPVWSASTASQKPITTEWCESRAVDVPFVGPISQVG